MISPQKNSMISYRIYWNKCKIVLKTCHQISLVELMIWVNIFKLKIYQGKKIDDIEKSINDLMNDIGVDEVDLEKDNWKNI